MGSFSYQWQYRTPVDISISPVTVLKAPVSNSGSMFDVLEWFNVAIDNILHLHTSLP
jgi:hypothetical protein